MDLRDLRPGGRVRTRKARAAVLSATEDLCCRDELMSRTNGERAQGGS